jgi:hypothetical protein
MRPYIAIKVQPALFHTQGGLLVDENAQVLQVLTAESSSRVVSPQAAQPPGSPATEPTAISPVMAYSAPSVCPTSQARHRQRTALQPGLT